MKFIIMLTAGLALSLAAAAQSNSPASGSRGSSGVGNKTTKTGSTYQGSTNSNNGNGGSRVYDNENPAGTTGRDGGIKSDKRGRSKPGRDASQTGDAARGQTQSGSNSSPLDPNRTPK